MLQIYWNPNQAKFDAWTAQHIEMLMLWAPMAASYGAQGVLVPMDTGIFNDCPEIMAANLRIIAQHRSNYWSGK